MDNDHKWPGYLLLSCSGLLLLISSGCFWQRNDYTERMKTSIVNYETEARLGRLLGDPFFPTGDFAIWLRPPRPTQLVQTPEGYLGWFQGNDPSGQLVEFIVMGTKSEQESLAQFQQRAVAALAASEKIPPPNEPPASPPPQTVQTMHGATVVYEYMQGAMQRKGASGAAVEYQWLACFAEEGPQKVMLAFFIPTTLYGAKDTQDAIGHCLASLALGPRAAAAQSTSPAIPTPGVRP
jgi:hypothetical protein